MILGRFVEHVIIVVLSGEGMTDSLKEKSTINKMIKYVDW